MKITLYQIVQIVLLSIILFYLIYYVYSILFDKNYQPKAGLEYFYPRLSPGGVIIVHDYNPDWPGIMKAVDDFATKIPEPIVLLPDVDSSVMIFKSREGSK